MPVSELSMPAPQKIYPFDNNQVKENCVFNKFSSSSFPSSGWMDFRLVYHLFKPRKSTTPLESDGQYLSRQKYILGRLFVQKEKFPDNNIRMMSY